MSGRREKQIKATPLAIKFSGDKGYTLECKITDGPQSLLDRIVSIQLTADQLDLITAWEPDDHFSRLQLNISTKGVS